MGHAEVLAQAAAHLEAVHPGHVAHLSSTRSIGSSPSASPAIPRARSPARRHRGAHALHPEELIEHARYGLLSSTDEDAPSFAPGPMSPRSQRRPARRRPRHDGPRHPRPVALPRPRAAPHSPPWQAPPRRTARRLRRAGLFSEPLCNGFVYELPTMRLLWAEAANRRANNTSAPSLVN